MVEKLCAFGLALVLLGSVGCEEGTPPPPVAKLSPISPKGLHPQGYWPYWSGPNGDLVSPETGWLAAWPEGGPRLLWRANVGTGFSSVAIAGDRLYTLGHRGGSDFVYCLDAATGQERWNHSYPCALVDNLHEGGPGATPTVDAGRVYTLSREGHLFCLDARTGRVVWSRQLERELGVYAPEWGFTCSPLVLDGRLIVDVGPTVAFDKESGKTLWQTEPHQPGYGSPTAFEHGSDRLVAVLNNDGLMVVRARDGTTAAFYRWETYYATNATTPIVCGETIFISSGYGKGCALLRYDGRRLQLVYRNRHIRTHFGTCVFWEGYLYGIDGQANNSAGCRLVCMRHETGEVAWTHRGFGCGSLVISAGKLIVLSDQGILATAEATPQQYREISRARVLQGRCWTIPVLAGHRIYCRSAAGDLACVDVAPQT